MIDQIRAWADQTLEELCRSCKTTCCDTSIHSISFAEDDLAVEMFGEYGISVVHADIVKKTDAEYYISHRLDENPPKLTMLGGQVILPPALVGMPQNHNSYHLYAEDGLCPLYKNQRCSVHDDPRRSNTCSEFPVHIIEEQDGITVQFYPTCPSINALHVRKRFRKTFSEPDIFLSIHVQDNKFKNRPKKGRTLHEHEYGLRL